LAFKDPFDLGGAPAGRFRPASLGVDLLGLARNLVEVHGYLEDSEVVLHQEELVVEKRVVANERVSLGKEPSPMCERSTKRSSRSRLRLTALCAPIARLIG